MNSSINLANRFREVILNGTWIAYTNFNHQLNGLNIEIANKKIGNLNSISILTQHIHYYIAGINNVFEVGTLDIKDKFSFDFPLIQSQNEWQNILENFWIDAEKLAQNIENLPEYKLNESFVESKYGTYQRNIDAMIEHSYYHLGQIVLIKKLLNSI